MEWHDHAGRQRGRDERARRTDTKTWQAERVETNVEGKIAGKGGCTEEFELRRRRSRAGRAEAATSTVQAPFQHYVNAGRSFVSSRNEPKQRLPSSLYRVAMNDTPYSDRIATTLLEFADSAGDSWYTFAWFDCYYFCRTLRGEFSACRKFGYP